jgi:hypothetical protein
VELKGIRRLAFVLLVAPALSGAGAALAGPARRGSVLLSAQRLAGVLKRSSGPPPLADRQAAALAGASTPNLSSADAPSSNWTSTVGAGRIPLSRLRPREYDAAMATNVEASGTTNERWGS